jgi:dTDP-4-dehydrorhamnose 3,5-epimerase
VPSKSKSRAEPAAKSPTAPDIEPGEIEGVVVRGLKRHGDGRGWLAELFREDEVAAEFRPVMAYASWTAPGLWRGPHEHREQADHFCFFGPSNFELRLWDNRAGSVTFGRVMRFGAGADDPKVVIVPAGVVHAYRNVGDEAGLVVNFPNRLYMGEGRREAVDEIRHEDDPETRFRLEDRESRP